MRRIHRGRERYVVFPSDPYSLEMRDWVTEHVSGKYQIDMLVASPLSLRTAYLFQLEDDAFRFKLWWG